MSELDQILARSQDPGSFAERRRFTLARDKALDKLRSFALRHPRQYVLELVQCAVFAGASWIAVDVDHEHMTLAWVGGERLHERELAGIFDYLFASRARAEHRHLVQLAIGVNAILARRARTVRIESGDGTPSGTLRVDLDRRGRGHVGQPERPMDGTYVHAEFGRDWLARLAGETLTEEEALVEERCRYTPVPILLNGRAPFGYKPSTRIRMYGTGEYEVFDRGHRRGYLRAPVPGVPADGFQMVVGGVRVCTLELPELGRVSDALGIREPMVAPGPLSGVICDDRLRKTADQADIVRDQRFVEMLAAVQEPATRLIQRVQESAYTPPALPPAEVQDADGEAVLPLGTQLGQVPPRPPLTLEHLEALEPDEPVFWVRRQDEFQVSEAVAPHRFPHVVLVLDPGQIPSFERRFPERALARLSTAGDVEFVRRALERGARARRRTLRPSTGVVLELSLRMSGPPVRYGVPRENTVPVCLRREDGLERLRAVEVGLPGVSARVQLDAAQPFPADAQLRRWLLQHAWTLVPEEVPAGGDALVVRRLVVGLLAAHARPHFVREGGRVTLELGLPAAWGRVRGRLRRWPLADAGGGPLTLERWLSAVQGGEVIHGLPPEQLADLHILEQRLGVGHLATELLHMPLVAVARVQGEWRRWTRAMGPAEELLWIDATLDPQPPPGRILAPSGAVGVGAVGVDGPMEAGMQALVELVVARLSGELARASGLRPEREAARLRLAALHLGAALGTLESLPVFADGSPLRSWREVGRRPVQPLGGVATPGVEVLELSWDELCVVEAELGRVELLLDDGPAVWDSLTDPEHPGWLLRQRVDAPGLQGWLGLRHPYDDTAAILLHSDGVSVLWGLVSPAVHGVLWSEQPSLAPPQREMVRLAHHQLLQAVAEALEAGSEDGERQHALQRHALRLCREAPESALARRVAPLVEVTGEDGRRWGTLASWLAAPVGSRPPLADWDHHHLDGHTSGEAGSIEERWTRRLLAALDDQLGHWGLQIRSSAKDASGPPVSARAFEGTTLRVELNPGHAEVAKALGGVERAAERILLEVARQVCAFARRQRLEVDLGTVQRVLISQRLTGGGEV